MQVLTKKISSFFRFARFEFLHSLQVVFQFINTSSVLGIGKFVRRRTFIFRFFQTCPLPASSHEVFFKFIFVSVYLVLQQIFHTKYKSGEVFIHSSRIKLQFLKVNEIDTLFLCSFLDTRQSNELARTHTMT